MGSNLELTSRDECEGERGGLGGGEMVQSTDRWVCLYCHTVCDRTHMHHMSLILTSTRGIVFPCFSIPCYCKAEAGSQDPGFLLNSL